MIVLFFIQVSSRFYTIPQWDDTRTSLVSSEVSDYFVRLSLQRPPAAILHSGHRPQAPELSRLAEALSEECYQA